MSGKLPLLKGRRQARLRAHRVEVVVVRAAVVEEEMLLEAEGIETVHDLAVWTARIVERVVRGLTAGARQKAKRGGTRVRGR